MYWLSITIGWARYTGLCVRIMGVVSNWYISNYQWFLMLGWQYFDMLCHVKVWTHQQDPWKSFVDGIYWLPRACVAVDSARYPCFFAPGQGRDGRGVNTRILFARRNSSWKWVPTQSENLQDRSRNALVGSNLVLSHTSTRVMPLLPFYLLQKPLRQTNVLTCVGAFIYQLPQEGHLAEVHDQEEEDEGADLGRFGVLIKS